MRKAILCIVGIFIICTLSACGAKKDKTVEVPQGKKEEIEKAETEKTNEIIPNRNNGTEEKTNIVEDSEIFEPFNGCAVLFDSEKQTYTFYNVELCKQQVSPCSTFKIISTLMGLHNQVIDSEESKLGSAERIYQNEPWNGEPDLETAFKNSCVWYFRKLIDEIGEEEVQKEIAQLHYGNCDISQWNGSDCNPYPELNGFWLDSSLKISPLEQVDNLRNILEGKTIYTQDEVTVLKNIMLVESNDTQKIYGKTGTGSNHTGWFVGFTERENTTVYFAVYLTGSNSETGNPKEVNGTAAKEIAFEILKKYE